MDLLLWSYYIFLFQYIGKLCKDIDIAVPMAELPAQLIDSDDEGLTTEGTEKTTRHEKETTIGIFDGVVDYPAKLTSNDEEDVNRKSATSSKTSTSFRKFYFILHNQVWILSLTFFQRM